MTTIMPNKFAASAAVQQLNYAMMQYAEGVNHGERTPGEQIANITKGNVADTRYNARDNVLRLAEAGAIMYSREGKPKSPSPLEILARAAKANKLDVEG